MATVAQIAANRLNAQKSTGPRTTEGKAASSTNALKSGIYAQSLIIRGVDPADLEALRDDFYAHHQPQSPDERALVDVLVHSEWTLRRLRKCATQLWETVFLLVTQPEDLQQTGLARGFIEAESYFTSVQCLINANERAFHRALADLERLKKSRTPIQPAETKAPSAELAPFPQHASEPHRRPHPLSGFGFVPANPAPAAVFLRVSSAFAGSPQ
jgi:hypothetical protein